MLYYPYVYTFIQLIQGAQLHLEDLIDNANAFINNLPLKQSFQGLL